VLVSDNNFSQTQVTQFIALGLDVHTAKAGSGWEQPATDHPFG
jgi:hypothetical protein